MRHFTVESTCAICIMPPMDHRIPITVITGYLGSGKTTLLNKLLRQPGMKDTAVVINEIGEAGLDHLLSRTIEETYIADNTLLLSSGCLCCILRTELADTLRDLYFKSSLMAIPSFDRLVIETTGLADPGPILGNLLNAEVIKEHYRLDTVVVTVDGQFGLQQLDAHEEARQQAAVADVLLITKADCVNGEALADLEQALRALNPSAEIHTVSHGDIDASRIIGTGLFDAQNQKIHPQRWLRPARDGRPRTLPSSSIHNSGIAHHTITLTEPLTTADLESALDCVCKTYGPDLLRLKGIVYLKDQPCPVAIHAVQHAAYPLLALAKLEEATPSSRIVVIGKSLDIGKIHGWFSAPNPAKVSL